LLGYICYTGEFIVIFFIRFILYISYITPWSLPLNLLPASLRAIARGFFIVFHIGTSCPSIIYCHLNLLNLPSHPHLYPPTLYLFYSLVCH
jgi:hypothetical protein